MSLAGPLSRASSSYLYSVPRLSRQTHRFVFSASFHTPSSIPIRAPRCILGPSRIVNSTCRWNSNSSAPSYVAELKGDAPALEAPKPGSGPQKIAQVEPRLSMTFTCTADGCGHRSTHEFSKTSYEKGIVLVQCPSCKNRHLIADHLGWFKESTESGKLKTVEDLLRAKGETIRKGRVNFDGDIEYEGEDGGQ